MVKFQTHRDAETDKKSNRISTLDLKKKKIRRSLEKKPKEHNPFAPGDFAKKRVLKLVKFSGHCRAIKS